MCKLQCLYYGTIICKASSIYVLQESLSTELGRYRANKYGYGDANYRGHECNGTYRVEGETERGSNVICVIQPFALLQQSSSYQLLQKGCTKTVLSDMHSMHTQCYMYMYPRMIYV